MALRWDSPLAQVLFTIFIALFPLGVPSMTVGWMVAVWLLAWGVGLNLLYSVIPWLNKLPLFIRITTAIGISAFAMAIAYTPAIIAWREEQAAKLTGHLYSLRNGVRQDRVSVYLGPQSKTALVWGGPPDSPMFSISTNNLQVKQNDAGDVIINTTVTDRNGNLIVEIINNEWRVSNEAWEKNYTKNALEVKDSRGRIVLQVRLFTSSIELQGEWWDEDGNGARIVEAPEKSTGAYFIKMSKQYHPDEPAIKEIFKYPSRNYFGQYANS